MFKVTYRPMWLGVLFTCLFIQMFVLLVTQVTIIKDYLLTYLNYDGPTSLMLHTKFHGNRPTGSGEEDF